MMKTNYVSTIVCGFLLILGCKDMATQVAQNNIPPKDSLTIPPSMPFDFEQMDTLFFNEKNTQYRLVEDTIEFRLAIQRKDNATWQTLDSFNRPRELSLEDWNKDGYLDISMGQKWHIDMALFNPTKNAFEKPFDIGEPDGVFLIDSTKKLYYSMLTNKFEDEHSRLFTIENYRQILRGYIDGFVGSEEYRKHEKPMGIYVYKFKNNTLPEEQLYEESNLELVDKFTMEQYQKMNTSQYQFYKEYWTKNAAKF